MILSKPCYNPSVQWIDSHAQQLPVSYVIQSRGLRSSLLSRSEQAAGFSFLLGAVVSFRQRNRSRRQLLASLRKASSAATETLLETTIEEQTSESHTDEPTAPRKPVPPGQWCQVAGVAVLRPSPFSGPTKGVVHFIGGAFFGAVPQWTYRSFLNELSRSGYWIIATPVATSFDQRTVPAQIAEAFEEAYAELLLSGLEEKLPVYSVGHSMGSMLSSVILSSSTTPTSYKKRIRGQVLIAFNTQSLAGAVPGWNDLWAKEEFRPAFRGLGELLEEAEKSSLPEVASRILDLATPVVRAAGFEGAATVLGGGERVKEVISPAVKQLPFLLKDVSEGVNDINPSDSEVFQILEEGYPSEIPLLLLRFENDGYDKTPRFEAVVRGKSEAPTKLEVKTLQGPHLLANFNEPLDLVDGTDALGRAALGLEAPLDGVLLQRRAELHTLVEAVGSFLDELSSDPASKGSEAADKRQRVTLRGLTANNFRHPLDLRQTRALERLPALGSIVRRVASIVELSVYQDNISSSILVSDKQYPHLHQMLHRACDILDIPKEHRPELYVRQNPVPNAYTLAVRGRRTFIVLHTALLDLCCEAEQEAVIAHELGHLKCEHSTWLAAANVLLLGASVLPLPARVLRPLLERVQEDLGAWQRAAELSCDRASLLVAQDPWIALSVMVKLSGGSTIASSKGVLPRAQLEAFLEQAKRYDAARAEANALEAMLGGMLFGRPRTHPMPVLRAREIRRWADSDEFWKLLNETGEPLQTTSEVPV